MQSQRLKTKPDIAKQMTIDDIIMNESSQDIPIRLFKEDYDDEKLSSIVATYGRGEVIISLVNEDGTIDNVDLRVMISCRNYTGSGIFILLLSNYKVYITDSLYFKEVKWSQELGYEVKELKAFVGDKQNLITKDNDSLVAAINEICRYVSCSRRLVGSLKYVVENENQLPTFTDDMTLCFRLDTKRFYYYSEALNDWIILPKGWAKLHYIIRDMEEVTKLNAELYEKVGTLADSIVHKLVSKENDVSEWEVDSISDNIGDEYIVQTITAKNKSASGSLLLTEKGWTIIFNQ